MTKSFGVRPSELGFNRCVEVESLRHGDTKKTFKATKNECILLAQRFDIQNLKHLSATLKIRRRGSGRNASVAINGHLDAVIIQTCVITLETFNSSIKSEFDATFDARNVEERGDIDVYLHVEDPPELIVDGIIDLGELISQSLALEIDLHPKKPRASIDLSSTNMINDFEIINETNVKHPFEALQKLKIKPKD